MSCAESFRVQAYLDGELDAVASAGVERHIEGCADCARLRADIVAIRDAIAAQATYHRADAGLRRRIRAALDGESRGPSWRDGRFWRGVASGGAATALAASLAFYVLTPHAADPVGRDLVDAHLRSLAGTHLIDIASSNHHVVKPWFAGRTDVSPDVADFAAEGFALVGGRVDYVDGTRAAVLVYRHGAHIANVFVWKDDGRLRPGVTSENGYRLESWRSGDLFYCIVSDMGAPESDALRDLMRGGTRE